jgi:hypothetical protein
LLLKDKGSIMAKRDKSTTHVEFTSSWWNIQKLNIKKSL